MKQNNCGNMQFNVPCLIYLREGKLLELVGKSRSNNFITTYFIINFEEDGCYFITLLYPIYYGNQFFLRKSDTNLFVEKSCICGFQWIYNVKIVKDLVIQSEYTDCIESSFKISQGFNEAIIWQSNLRKRYTGKVFVNYVEGEEPFLEVEVKYMNQLTKQHILTKNNPVTLDLTNVQLITLKKPHMETEVYGEFVIDTSTTVKQII